MDLEEFYAADERRRKSTELEFGRDWRDENGRCGVSWIEDTGEVYVMREPNAAVTGSGAGDLELVPMSDEALGVEALGTVTGRPTVESVMSGCEERMPAADGIAWLRDRVGRPAPACPPLSTGHPRPRRDRPSG